MVTHQVGVLQFMVADGALVLSIDYLGDAVFAEGVTALGDVGIGICLEADDALCELTYDVVDADLDCFIVLRLAFLQAGWGSHWDFRFV